jgi:hypothetical protein
MRVWHDKWNALFKRNKAQEYLALASIANQHEHILVQAIFSLYSTD